jgi:hypothetical protein
MCRGQGRRQVQRPQQARLGGRPVAFVHHLQVTQLAVGVGQFGVELDRPLGCAPCRLQRRQRRQHVMPTVAISASASSAKGGGMAGHQRHRLVAQLHRLAAAVDVVAAHRDAGQAQPVQPLVGGPAVGQRTQQRLAAGQRTRCSWRCAASRCRADDDAARQGLQRFQRLRTAFGRQQRAARPQHVAAVAVQHAQLQHGVGPERVDLAQHRMVDLQPALRVLQRGARRRRRAAAAAHHPQAVQPGQQGRQFGAQRRLQRGVQGGEGGSSNTATDPRGRADGSRRRSSTS